MSQRPLHYRTNALKPVLCGYGDFPVQETPDAALVTCETCLYRMALATQMALDPSQAAYAAGAALLDDGLDAANSIIDAASDLGIDTIDLLPRKT